MCSFKVFAQSTEPPSNMNITHRMRRRAPGARVELKKMMKCIFLGKQLRAGKTVKSAKSSEEAVDHSVGSVSAQAAVTETNINTSTIEEAESTLRESGYLNYEEARALLGRLEYQKGNMEAAFRVFEGIDIEAVTPNIKVSLARRCEPQRRQSQSDAAPPMSMHAVTLLFEAIFLKAKSLWALGRFEEAAQSCQVILDTIESALPDGLKERFAADCKLQETLNKAVELLPESWKLGGSPHEAISSYRRALLYNWNLDLETRARIEKEFAIFLLYSGVEANPPTLRFQVQGAFIPRNNMEEAILLLLLLLMKFLGGKIVWDPSIMDHLSFALAISGGLETLAYQLEELPVDIMNRKEKQSTLALCYHGARQNRVALNLLKNLLNDRENPNCTHELLLAAKISAEDSNTTEEGIDYAKHASERLIGQCGQLRSKANCFLGILSSAKSRSVASDSKRKAMQSEALKALETAEELTQGADPNVIYHLSFENAEQRKLGTALSYAKRLLKLEAGSSTRGWILLSRILSAEKRYIDAETIVNAALEQTGRWEHAELLRTKAKLQLAQGQTMNAIQTYTHLLAVLQARKKSFGIGKKLSERRDQDRILELETWHDLADLYTSQSQWQDAEVCLSKSEALCPYSASRCYSRGLLYEAKGQDSEAQQLYWEALDIDPDHVPSLISIAKLLMKLGDQSVFPVARSFVRHAIRVDWTNHAAWYTLGLLQKSESPAEAVACFEAAVRLEQTAPVEPFR